MASEWGRTTLTDLCILANGKAVPKTGYVEDGRAVVWGSNGPIGRVAESRFDQEVAVIGRVGAYCGSVHRAPGPSWVTDNAISAVAQPNVSQRFIYYLLKYLPLAHHRSGSAQPLLTQRSLKPISCPAVPPDEQRRIAAVLGALDDKIELNRKMNRTLEAMAQALFKSWFIDFDGHDDLVPSELGPIPRGWEVGTVGQLGQVITGKTPPTKDPANYGGQYPFLKIPDMHGRVWAMSTGTSLSEKGHCTQRKKLIPPGAVAVSCIATPGLAVLVREPTHTNQQINTVVPAERHCSEWLFFALRSLGHLIRARASGGSVTRNLNKGQFSKLPILNPPGAAKRHFREAVAPLLERIAVSEKESFTLAALRDTLLPKLISGEIRVPEAEDALQEAGL